ncbi:MAG: very short patch repair endonuclease [Frankiales bacterium]|nr:very short patch repair endonuclease [Frankiales bacterium]
MPVVLPPAPAASSENARRVLSRTRRRDTAPELALRRALFALGMRFLVDAPAPGCGRRRRVDVLLRGPRIAVLVHGCFWHSCPEHFHPPKANGSWWALKMASIRERDADTLVRLGESGWLPVVVWEHEDMGAAALRLQELARRRCR